MNDEDVKIIIYVLAESVAARLRENGFRCKTVELSIRSSNLVSFTRQTKINAPSNVTREIAEDGYNLFLKNCDWKEPIRSVGVRGADLVTDVFWDQIDLFQSVERREKLHKVDIAIDSIRGRFGYYSIQRGLMYQDRLLSALNAKEDNVVHPHGYF